MQCNNSLETTNNINPRSYLCQVKKNLFESNSIYLTKQNFDNTFINYFTPQTKPRLISHTQNSFTIVKTV